MKARTLSAIAFTSLLALGGTAYAAENPNDNYHRAFPGDSGIMSYMQGGDTMGKAAFGTPSDTSSFSEGHAAYYRAFFGVTPSKAPASDSAGKAAYGKGNWAADGNLAYHRSFRGD